jgi:hypothetical protein
VLEWSDILVVLTQTISENIAEVRNCSAVIAGVARNCRRGLLSTLQRLEDVGKLFRSAHHIYVTNDSTDDTAQVLNEWSAGHRNVTIIELDGLAHALPQRTVRLAFARNMYLRELRRDAGNGMGCDLLIVADLDGLNSGLTNGDEFELALATAPNDWGALFAKADLRRTKKFSYSGNECLGEASTYIAGRAADIGGFSVRWIRNLSNQVLKHRLVWGDGPAAQRSVRARGIQCHCQTQRRGAVYFTGALERYTTRARSRGDQWQDGASVGERRVASAGKRLRLD